MRNASSRPAPWLERTARVAAVPVRWIDRVCGGTLWDRLALGVAAMVTLLVAATFQDYGITTDEYVQQIYGEKLWDFYLSGFADRSVFHFENLYLYGGLFDMLAVAVQQVLPLDTYDVRHLLCGLIGVCGIVGTWRLARQAGGPRVGFLAAAMLALSASWYGAMFNNTKDIPFAAGMTWMLYFTYRAVADLPRPRLRDVLCLGVVTGLTLGQRFGAILGLFYLALPALGYVLLTAHRLGWRVAAHDAARALVGILPAIPIAYAVMGLFWPWSMLSPLNPLDALLQLTEWPFRTEFNGVYYQADDLPWTYLPSYLAIKLPEIVLLGALLSLGFCAASGLQARTRPDLRQVLPFLTLVLAVIVPLAYVLVARPAIYNGMRHFFFLMPPLYTIAAVGLERLWFELEQRRRWVGTAFALLLIAAATRELTTMVELHPHEYVYFNSLVGGTGGAYRNYELDYWSNFVPEAVEKLDRQIRSELKGKRPLRTYFVGVCNAPRSLDKFAIPYLKMTQDWKTADFIIPTTNGDCDLYADGRIIITIERDGAVLGVVKDRRPGNIADGSAKQTRIR